MFQRFCMLDFAILVRHARGCNADIRKSKVKIIWRILDARRATFQ